MKTFTKTFTILLLSMVGYSSFAQQSPLVSQYMFNQLYLNPAYAGCHPYTDATMLFRDQWVGFNGAPTTEIASIDGTLENKNMGLGFTILNDHIGVSNQTGFTGSYSYHLKLNDNQTLGLGLSGGAEIYQAQLTDLVIWDQGDNVFSSNIQSKLIPTFGTGAYLYTDQYYVGLSIPNILSYKPNTFLYLNMNNDPELQRSYYLTGGYYYTINDNVILKPSLLFLYTQAAPFEVNINLSALLDKVVTAGISYRTGDSFIAMVGVYIKNNFHIGYAYDYPITSINNISSGSQEICLEYIFNNTTKNTRRPKF